MPADTKYDFIIIGSGSSGGVAAYMLQEAGARCLLLEAGTHFTRKDFPMDEAVYTPQLFWGGGADFNSRATMGFLRGKCVGGGSVVNQALMDRFDAVAFDDWRDESGVDFFSVDAMTPHYDFAEANLVRQEIPPAWRNENANLFVKGMESAGLAWKPLIRGQRDCGTEEGNDCIACLGGCHRGSKQSTLETYIPRALALGLELHPNTEVGRIESQRGEVTVHARRDGQTVTYTAENVIVASGSLGSTRLLLNSGLKKRLPALGEKFTMHPQVMNFAIMPEPVDAHRGALQGVCSSDSRFRGWGFKLENVFAPPIAIAVLYQHTGNDLQQFMHEYRHFACMEVCVRDENTGTLRINGQGRLRIDKNLTDQDRSRVQNGRDVVYEIFSGLKPKRIVQPPWCFGLHMMGGCSMGLDPKTSVVSPSFQVHGLPNVYVADSSVFPNAPGINPALTVMALTHRMASALTKAKAATKGAPSDAVAVPQPIPA